MSMLKFLIVCCVCWSMALGAGADTIIYCYVCSFNQTACSDSGNFASLYQPCQSTACYKVTATKSGGGYWFQRGCVAAAEDGTSPADGTCSYYKSDDGQYIGNICYCSGTTNCNTATSLAQLDFVKIFGLTVTAVILTVAQRFA